MTKTAFFALAVIVAAGCSSAPEISETNASTPEANVGKTAQQLSAFRALEGQTAKHWKWLQHERFLTPAHLSAPRTGKPVLVSGKSAETSATA